MTLSVVDSDRRCPYDSKRMFFEVGQHEDTGATEAVHRCWSCEYFELDTAWRSRVPVVLAEIGQAEVKQ